jgi:hypothetical protein
MEPNSLKTGIFLFLLLCFQLACSSQPPVKKEKATAVMPVSAYKTQNAVAIRTDTTPIQRAYLARKIRVNPSLQKIVSRAPLQPPGEDLGKYLQSRQDCNVEKSIDSNNCVLVKYPDGLIKKYCDGKLTEIVTPDGKRHALNQVYMYVPKLPPPQVSSNDPTYVWLASFNDELLKDIQNLLNKDQDLINQYLQREGLQCQKDVFRQVVYRMTFMENFLVTN